MNRRTFGAVMVICGFFIFANGKLPGDFRGIGVGLAIIGILLLVIRCGKNKETTKK
jgi:hypothetical protein